MEEPGRLQFMGLLRVGHDWATSLSLFPFMHWRRKWQPLQCSCLENPRDGGAWWAAVYGVAQSRTRLKRLSTAAAAVHNLSKTILTVNYFLIIFCIVYLYTFLLFLGLTTESSSLFNKLFFIVIRIYCFSSLSPTIIKYHWFFSLIFCIEHLALWFQYILFVK